MVTKILLIIMLVLYVALLIMRYKKKDNPAISVEAEPEMLKGGVSVLLKQYGKAEQKKLDI